MHCTWQLLLRFANGGLVLFRGLRVADGGVLNKYWPCIIVSMHTLVIFLTVLCARG